MTGQPCTQPLQRVMNAATRVIMNLLLRDHVKPALKQLHWLPVEQRIIYKLCLFMHHIHTGQAPQYLSDCVSAVSALSACRQHGWRRGVVVSGVRQ